MIPILKYPRTPHIAGSRLQPGDEDLGMIAPEVLEAGSLVIEEKLDGSNSGISFAAVRVTATRVSASALASGGSFCSSTAWISSAHNE